MTREEIQAELDALKGTKFDKVTDRLLQLYDKDLPCELCGEFFNAGTLLRHKKTCKDDLDLQPKVLAIYHNGTMPSSSSIARELKVPQRVVNRILDKLKLQSWIGGKSVGLKSIERWELIKPQLDQGISMSKIAENLGLKFRDVEYLANQNNYVFTNSNQARGKLLRAEFKNLYDKGLTDRQIAEIMQKDKTQIGNWRKRYNLPPNTKS